MSLVIIAIFYIGAGWLGLFAFLGAAAISIRGIESVNYVSHYGLVRVPGTAIAVRHSWNSSRLISTSLMINFSRHSDHHMSATTPYWKLKMPVEGEAPLLPYGAITMGVIALVPPLYFKLVKPQLDYWDEHLASPGERAYLEEQAYLQEIWHGELTAAE